MNSKFTSVADLRNAITSKIDPVYAAKMLQPIPDMPTVKDRKRYLVEKSRDKIVLDIGCTGPISKLIKQFAKKYYGIDKTSAENIEAVELDHRPDLMPKYEDVEVIICAETLEHLSNPGYFLLALKDKYPGKTIYITVPNAGSYQVTDDCEVINKEHVCWYSYSTIKSLLTRYDFNIIESRWYNGPEYKAEGLIMVCNG